MCIRDRFSPIGRGWGKLGLAGLESCHFHAFPAVAWMARQARPDIDSRARRGRERGRHRGSARRR
eukprot:8849382-Alexandrium_andersonii.AAC.1